MAGESGLGREHYYLDFSAHLDENIDKVLGGNSSPSPTVPSLISDVNSDRTVVSVAESPSSPVTQWQEGKLGSGGEEGGGEARELHWNTGQHLHGGQSGGAQICKGNSQTEERFKLNAKAGQEKTRGASDKKG